MFLFLTVQSIKKEIQKKIPVYGMRMCAHGSDRSSVLNAIAVKIPAKYMKFDTSAFRIYSLSESDEKSG